MVAIDDRHAGPLGVLHIVGSPTSAFYHDLSLVYASHVVRPSGTLPHFAAIEPGATWRQGPSLSDLGPPDSFASLVENLPPIHVVVSHLFCVEGMTTIRGLFEEVLGLAVVGPSAGIAGVSANKALSKEALLRCGLRVPEGIVVTENSGRSPVPLPVIVKPNREDNSVGVSLVRSAAEWPNAVTTALQHDREVLVEEFIPGREIRTCAIEREGGLWIPEMIEYEVTELRPIRTVDDKLAIGESGTPEGQTRTSDIPASCPAQIDEGLREKLAEATREAHVGLGCRDFSLFDFRIDADSGEPYLLEAGLFWSFSDISMISRMIEAAGADLEGVISEVWHRAAERSRRTAPHQ